MSKTSIRIIKLGHIDKIIDFNFLESFNSELFEITEITKVTNLPPSQNNNGFLNIVYTVDEIQQMLSNTQSNSLCIAIMDYSFNDNFYMHKISQNIVCISTSDLDSILQKKNISLENFILKNIYEIFVLYTHFNQSLSDDIYNFVHTDTRGCLFDLNGDKLDIIHNTELPIICNSCKSTLNQKKIIDLALLEKELKKIKKPFITSIELFIKENPLTSMVITFLISIPINLLSNLIWSWLIK